MTTTPYTQAAADIAIIAIRAKLHSRGDSNAETACFNDVVEAVTESTAMLGLWADDVAAIKITGEAFGILIRGSAIRVLRYTYTR